MYGKNTIRLLSFLKKAFENYSISLIKYQKVSLLVALAIMAVTFFSAKFLGTEFLPELNEGALWVESELPMSVSLPEADRDFQ